VSLQSAPEFSKWRIRPAARLSYTAVIAVSAQRATTKERPGTESLTTSKRSRSPIG
jgi:hypothetical protein